MAIDFDAIRKKLNQLSGNNSKRRAMWRPPEGETVSVRILGFTDNDGNPFKERWFYYNIGNNPGLLAPYQFGKPDPINELIQKLKDEGTKESYEMAKKLYPKMRTYAAVVVRGEESEGVKLWAFGKTVYQSLLNIMLDPDYGDITDVYEGHDVKVTCSKPPGKMYAMTEVMPRPKTTALGTKAQINEWTSNIPDLDDLYTLKSYEQLETIVNNWLTGDADEESTNGNNSTFENSRVSKPTKSTPVQQSKKKSGTTEKSFDDIDDAFADLEDDMGF
ncbi:MAG: hypothetical protein CBC29_07275 [Methylococcaceae bacterium TMED69]|nr:MAG: hypothetical protein CBC29_05450 [Methylococcaceae bacterium TMED69]OUU74921.1 MAG: hypothetical protein CBC29_07275 [Methylococcaceae bacterium TMED69]|tara:strand:+ start:206 stop:1030 length:825 start_codon:yes stop_codon:yes gene_type:complete